MQVKVNILEGLQRKITVEIPSVKVEDEILQGLKKAQKGVKIDGFRKGKVPMNIVKQRYGSSVRQDVLGKLIETSYEDAIKQEKLIPAGQPKVNPVSGFSANEPFIYEAIIEIIPEFDVKGLDSLTVKKPVSSITNTDVEKMINTLRKQAAKWESSDKPSKNGERLCIDFVGKIDGKSFHGGSGNDMTIILGEKQLLPEFENSLLGKKQGDKVIAKVTFPDNYHDKSVIGKTAEFTIDIKSIEKAKIPKVDKEFIKHFGIVNGSIKDLEKSVRENMERELDNGIRRHINQQVMQHLVTANKVMVPESMVAQEKERMAHEQKLEQNVPNAEDRKKIVDDNFDKPARRRVLLGIIMGKLLEAKKVKPDAERVKGHIEKIASTYENPQGIKDYYQKTPGAIEKIYAQVMEEQLIDQLLSEAKVVEKKCSFDDVMQGNFTS